MNTDEARAQEALGLIKSSTHVLVASYSRKDHAEFSVSDFYVVRVFAGLDYIHSEKVVADFARSLDGVLSYQILSLSPWLPEVLNTVPTRVVYLWVCGYEENDFVEIGDVNANKEIKMFLRKQVSRQ